MGCDEHPYVEAKIFGKWVYLGALTSYRNYGMFGIMSGVRDYDEGKRVLEDEPDNRREFPRDLSKALETKLRWELRVPQDEPVSVGDSGYHSENCLYGEEIKQAIKLFIEEYGEYQEHYTGVVRLLEHPLVEDVRVIIYYDS